MTPNSRSYLNHFTQPDSIVPDPYNSQDYDRYAYVRNNPLKYTDPSGHAAWNDKEGNNTLNTLTDGDKQLKNAWVSIWKTDSGKDLAWNIVKTKTPIKWTKLPLGNSGMTTHGCTDYIESCEIQINETYKTTDQNGNSYGMASDIERLDNNQIIITLAHEAFHLNYGTPFSQDSLYEEYLAYHTEHIVRHELEAQGYDFTGITLHNFNDAHPFSSAGLDEWFTANDLAKYYPTWQYQYYDYSHRGDVWWQVQK